jgi:hypothetical protein
LSEAEFWDSTPRQFSALLDRKRTHDDFLAALSAVTPYVISSALAGKKRPPKFEDFVLTRRR